MTRGIFTACVVWIASVGVAMPRASAPQASASDASSTIAAADRGVVDKYCVSCHNQRLKTSGLALDTAELSDVAAHPEVWEKVIRKVGAGMMPPAGVPRPDDAAKRALISRLEGVLDNAAKARPNPGRPLVHRLNRAEYANAIRDLLAVELDVSSMLPPDDSSGGFDNNADVLGLSPVLLESYLTAAERITALAIGDPKAPPMGELFRVRQDESQDRHIEGLPLGTVGGILIPTTLPLDGEYQFQVRLFRTNLGTMRGLEYAHQLEISVNGERVHLASFGGDNEITASSDNPTITGDDVDGRFTVRVPLKAGPAQIGVAFVEKTHALNTRRLQSYVRSSSDTIDFSGYPHIDEIILTGPFKVTGVGDTPSRRRIFVCQPKAASEEDGCARKILATLARRAYRGDVSKEDLQTLQDFYQRGRQDGSFDTGIDLALRRMLSSPKFLVRVERDPASLPAGSAYRLSDLEIASRLSFFLWSSIPDDTLLDVASKGGLKTPAGIDQQVRRMLADPKSQAFVDNFVGQWLQLRNLKTKQPNSHEFPDFDDNLRTALGTEAEMFFASIMREDRSVVDLMTADYTFVNERLARHYGIPNVYGSRFRRVTLGDDSNRGGILGQGSILTVTSYANRTSPVLRGKWILENIVGTPPPPPPPNVPPLKDTDTNGRLLSMRERMAQHRASPACAGCHQLMDPAGLSMENFDAIGRWRVRTESGSSVDASGGLPDGSTFTGMSGLRAALLRKPDMFVGTLTEKLMTYGLGRGLEYYDAPTVRDIVRDARGQDYRFSSLVLGIVSSDPFQMRMSQ